MATGTTQTLVVCVPATSATSAQQVACPKVGTQFYVPSRVQGYVVDPSQASLFDMAVEPLDPASVVAVWSVSFSFVIACFIAARVGGSVLSLIRKG
jgi:hypothetical protein